MLSRTVIVALLTAGMAAGAVAQGKSDDKGKRGDAPGHNKDGRGAASSHPGNNGAGKPGKPNGTPWNYGQVISSLRNGSADPDVWADAIEGLDGGSTVGLVTLTQLRGRGAENAVALDNALAGDAAALADARDAIRTNIDLLTALSNAGYLADDIVAVYVKTNNEVVLIVDDRL